MTSSVSNKGKSIHYFKVKDNTPVGVFGPRVYNVSYAE
jgi:hypothetical protein